MPTNNFKLFDENKANMMTDDDYAINQQRLNGVQSGVASSQLQNKTLYQTALMCYALAQLMAANGYDANDANAVSTFVNNLSLSMVQKVVDKASANDVANQVAGKWVDAKQLGELKADIADNYLPLLGGTMLGDLILNRDPTQSLQAATKQYVDGNDILLYTGQYVGTGDYGVNNPTSVTFPFEPILFFFPTGFRTINVNELTQNYKSITTYTSQYGNFNLYIKKSGDGKTIYWYSEDGATDQSNEGGTFYTFAAIGGYDMGGLTEWLIENNSTFVVPKSGNYLVELYGGGGGAIRGSKYQGGSSCDVINLTLQKGESYQIIVGAGRGNGDGTATSFGNRTVAGGKVSTSSSGGAGSGNKGTTGVYAEFDTKNVSSGTLGSMYGYGVNARGSTAFGTGGPGAVYIKYLGE